MEGWNKFAIGLTLLDLSAGTHCKRLMSAVGGLPVLINQKSLEFFANGGCAGRLQREVDRSNMLHGASVGPMVVQTVSILVAGVVGLSNIGGIEVKGLKRLEFAQV